MKLQIGISKAERDGRIVAHAQSATFSGPDLKRLAPERKCYVVSFFGYDDWEPITFYAIDDETAKEYASAKWRGTFQITERITTWRQVAEIEL